MNIANVIVGVEIALLALFVLAMLVSAIKDQMKFIKECKSKGLDWQAEDEELQLWRDLLRGLNLKFLIRKKYRNI